jgi:hypothetical protein
MVHNMLQVQHEPKKMGNRVRNLAYEAFYADCLGRNTEEEGNTVFLAAKLSPGSVRDGVTAVCS